jgi:hypothetical protein
VKLLLIMVVSSTVYTLEPLQVPTGATCEEIYNKNVYYVENQNYNAGSMQSSTNGFYQGKLVGGYICETEPKLFPEGTN